MRNWEAIGAGLLAVARFMRMELAAQAQAGDEQDKLEAKLADIFVNAADADLARTRPLDPR